MGGIPKVGKLLRSAVGKVSFSNAKFLVAIIFMLSGLGGVVEHVISEHCCSNGVSQVIAVAIHENTVVQDGVLAQVDDVVKENPLKVIQMLLPWFLGTSRGFARKTSVAVEYPSR